MAIDAGSAAIDRLLTEGFFGYSGCVKENPVNANGVLTTVQMYGGTAANAKVGTLYGTGLSFTGRDYETVNFAGGVPETVTGLNIDAQTGDYIGFYNIGYIDRDGDGDGVPYLLGDGFDGSAHTYTDYVITVSFYATGTETAAGQPYMKRLGGVQYAALNRGVF